MSPKVSQLKAALSRAGFSARPGKGSHTIWTHPALPTAEIAVSGKDGEDAKKYQIKLVRNALKELGEVL